MIYFHYIIYEYFLLLFNRRYGHLCTVLIRKNCFLYTSFIILHTYFGMVFSSINISTKSSSNKGVSKKMYKSYGAGVEQVMRTEHLLNSVNTDLSISLYSFRIKLHIHCFRSLSISVMYLSLKTTE